MCWRLARTAAYAALQHLHGTCRPSSGAARCAHVAYLLRAFWGHSLPLQDYIWTPHVNQFQPGHPDFKRTLRCGALAAPACD